MKGYMSKNGKWCTSANGETFDGDFFETKAEAIHDFIEKKKQGSEEHQVKVFWVGQASKFIASQFINADRIIDDAQDCAVCEAGEYADDWLSFISKEEMKELDDLLEKWVKKNKLEPNFYQIRNSERIEL